MISALRFFTVLVVCLGRAAPTRILFGSCNDARLAQPLWPHILSRRPDLWIWGGDNIYADRFELRRLFGGKPPFRPADKTYLQSVYAKQLKVPGYRQLLNTSVPIVGTWDDHDYGVNDGDKYFEGKGWSQAAFLDFLQVPLDSPQRLQRGVYTSHRFDFNGGSVLVIILDMRFHRDAYGEAEGDFLGEAQWQWLEQTLASSTARMLARVCELAATPAPRSSESWRELAPFPGLKGSLLTLAHSKKSISSGCSHW